jgi:hypothetical protein
LDGDLFWIDTVGKIARHESVDVRNPSGQADAMRYFGIPMAVPSPAAIIGLFVANPWAAEAKVPESFGYSAALTKALQELWPAFLIEVAIGVVMAGFCYRRHRKYGLPWTGVWTGFVLLFGVPAYLGYLAHRAWPARLACPNCGRLAPRDRSACFLCGHEFPTPAAKGIEILVSSG